MAVIDIKSELWSSTLSFSRYATRQLDANPALADLMAAAASGPITWDPVDVAALSDCIDQASLHRSLRILRRKVMLWTMARFGGVADLAEVCTAFSRLADLTLRAAANAHHRWLAEVHGDPIGEESGLVQQLHVVGMGKLGGEELNVSSDIDLVFVYAESGDTNGARPISNAEFFDRLSKRVIAAMHDMTADGFVFRMDMRLRPYGDSGPLSCSLAFLEEYLLTQGRTWERYAWLKARIVTGDREQEIRALIDPFVYRKYLDYDAYGGLRDVHSQIKEQGRRRDYASNIKLGPGGIREIEFTVQALQLVRGGREPALRQRNTLSALTTLGQRGLLPASAVRELGSAYDFLRRLEHRLQYRDDQQTQSLPSDPGELAAIAQSMGFDAAPAFDAALECHRTNVSNHFEAVLGTQSQAPVDALTAVWIDPSDIDARRQALAAHGYKDPGPVIQRLATVRESTRYRQLPARSIERFDTLVPMVLHESGNTSDPTRVFNRFIDLLETVSRRSSYLALLAEHPPILPRIAHILEASSWAADYLLRHPILLDELLDTRTLLAEPDWTILRQELDATLAALPGDAERQMDALRHFQHTATFRLLAQDLLLHLTVERLADHLSALANLVLAATMRQCWTFVQAPASSPAKPAHPRFAIIAYGKLGGLELGYASDLDLVFIYDDEGENDDAAELYTRLGQRINTWLTATTAAGPLYETDLRLRPDGASGLLVRPFSAFRRYQREKAWVWEHQALSRARFAAGDVNLGAAFELERETILRTPRDRKSLCAEVIAMRRKMFAGHPNPSRQFDLKHDPGGMVDVEFIVQYLVLANSHGKPALTRNLGNIALLQLAAQLDLIDLRLATDVADAYREYRRLQHQIRLQGAPNARVDADTQVARRRQVRALWVNVFGAAWEE